MDQLHELYACALVSCLGHCAETDIRVQWFNQFNLIESPGLLRCGSGDFLFGHVVITGEIKNPYWLGRG